MLGDSYISIVCINIGCAVTVCQHIDLVCIGCEYGIFITVLAKDLTERVTQQVRHLARSKLCCGLGGGAVDRIALAVRKIIAVDHLACIGFGITDDLTNNQIIVVHLFTAQAACVVAILHHAAIRAQRADDAAYLVAAKYVAQIDAVLHLSAVCVMADNSAQSGADIANAFEHSRKGTALYTAIVFADNAAKLIAAGDKECFCEAILNRSGIPAYDRTHLAVFRIKVGICQRQILDHGIIIQHTEHALRERRSGNTCGHIFKVCVQTADRVSLSVKDTFKADVGLLADGRPLSESAVVELIGIAEHVFVDRDICGQNSVCGIGICVVRGVVRGICARDLHLGVDVLGKPVQLACVVDLIVALCILRGLHEAVARRANAVYVSVLNHYARLVGIADAARSTSVYCVKDRRARAFRYKRGQLYVFGIGKRLIPSLRAVADAEVELPRQLARSKLLCRLGLCLACRISAVDTANAYVDRIADQIIAVELCAAIPILLSDHSAGERNARFNALVVVNARNVTLVEAILYGAVIVSDDTANRIHTLNGLDIMALIHGAAVVSDNAANVLIAGDGAVIIALVHGSPTVSNYAADVLAVVGALRLCLGACNTFYDTQVVRVFYIAAATGHAANAACAGHYAHIRAIQNIGGVVIITDHAADVSCAGYVAGVCAALDGFATPAEQTADVLFTADEPTVFAIHNGFYLVGSISDHAAHVLCADNLAFICALVEQSRRICVANHAANVLLAGHRAPVLAKEYFAARFEISDHAAHVILTLYVGISDRTAVHSAGHVAEQALIVVGAVDINVRNPMLAATECSRVGSGAAADGRPFPEHIKRFIRAILIDRCTNIEVDIRSQNSVCACILRNTVQRAVDKPCKPEQLACVGNFVITLFLVIYCGLECIALGAEAVGVCPEGVGRSLALKRSIVCIAGSRTVTRKALIDLVCIGCEYGSRIGADGLSPSRAEEVRNLAALKLCSGFTFNVFRRAVFANCTVCKHIFVVITVRYRAVRIESNHTAGDGS